MKKNILLKLSLSIGLVALLSGCATILWQETDSQEPESRETVRRETKKQMNEKPADVNKVASITDIKLQDNSLEIISNKHFLYTMYTASDPYKISIDIPDMRSGSFKDRIVSDKAGITAVVVKQLDSATPSLRIEVVLQSPSLVTPIYKDNSLLLIIKPEEPVVLTSPQSADALAAVKKETDSVISEVESSESKAVEEQASDNTKSADKAPGNNIPALSPATEVISVELKKSNDALKVLISGNGALTPNVFPIDDRIVVDIPGVAMKAAVPTSVSSPLKGIRTGRYKDKVRLVLDLKEKTTFDVAATGNSIEITLKKKEFAGTRSLENGTLAHRAPGEEPAPKEMPSKERIPATATGDQAGTYKGDKISLDFQDAEIGPILRLLADVKGYNLVLDAAVKGKITIKLLNVPWDQAMDIIMNQSKLSNRIDGNILWIAPADVFDKIAKEKAKAKVSEEEVEELVQEVIRINYATASEISAAITTGKLLSPRGSVTIDSRMNTLIVKDTQRSINKVKDLMKIMDVVKPQVMIEAKLVEVDSNYSESLGIRWGGTASVATGINPISGTFSVNSPVVASGSGTANPGGSVGLTIGAANNLKVDLSLSALESIGKSKTLSNPKVLTMDNEAATIQQGTTFFIPTVSQSGTSSQPQTATLSLNVTPKITPDGYVQLKIQATDNSLQQGTAGASAVVNTKSLTTQALVKNGETLVVGGIYRVDESETSDRVPLLGKVPGLGWLFKTKSKLGPNTQELLIFITPTIVERQDNK